MMPLVLFFFSWVCLGISSLLHVYRHEHCQAGQTNITIRYKKLVCLYALWHHCAFTKKEDKETALPAEKRGPGCARCWLSPGCPWLPHSSHSICARLGTAVPGQRESSTYSLFLRTLPRQEETWEVM